MTSEQVLGVIFKHDPIWVIGFFEKRITYKENESNRYDSISDRPSELFKFDVVPHRPHHLFEGVDWNDQNALAALKRVRDWVLTSSNLLRFEAPILLTSMIGGDDPRSDRIKINTAMQKLLEQWIDSGDLELMRGGRLSDEGIRRQMLSFIPLRSQFSLRSGGDKEVQGGITAALSSGVSARTIGKPAVHLVRRTKDLEAWRDRANSPIVERFAEGLIDMTQQEIEWLAQEDEEFLEGEEW